MEPPPVPGASAATIANATIATSAPAPMGAGQQEDDELEAIVD
jgi:hypothetical protein